MSATLSVEPVACPGGRLCAAPQGGDDELAICERMLRERGGGACAPRIRAALDALLRAEDGRHPSAPAWKQLLVSLQCFGLLR